MHTKNKYRNNLQLQWRTTSFSDIHPIFFFDEFHIQQFSGPHTTTKLNDHNIRFSVHEEGNIDIKSGKYYTNNKPRKATFNDEQEGILCLNVARIEIK